MWHNIVFVGWYGFFANNMLVARYSAVRDAMAAAVRLNFCRIIILVDSKELQWMCSCRNPCWLKSKKLQPGQLISLCYFFLVSFILNVDGNVSFSKSLFFSNLVMYRKKKKGAKISPKQSTISTWNVVICLNFFEMFRKHFI